MFIIITKSQSSEAFGPFLSRDDANTYAMNTPTIVEWWVYPLIRP